MRTEVREWWEPAKADMRGISWATEIKSVHLTVTMNLCQKNFSDLDHFLNFCHQKHLKHEVGQYLAAGRAATCIDGIQLSKDQRSLYDSIQPNDRRKTKRPFRRRSCDLGQIAILANGNVTPCVLLQNGSFVMGNVLNSDLEEIWNSVRFRQYRGLTVDNIPVCQECEDRYICGGGCIAEKYAYWGTAFAPHPFCYSDSAIEFFEKESRI